jgi:hypothetical protein
MLGPSPEPTAVAEDEREEAERKEAEPKDKERQGLERRERERQDEEVRLQGYINQRQFTQQISKISQATLQARQIQTRRIL